MKTKTILVALVLLITCIIIVQGYDPDGQDYNPDEDGIQEIDRDQDRLSRLFKRSATMSRRGFGYRSSTRITRRSRKHFPWKIRTTKKSPPVISRPTTTTSSLRPSLEICRNHTVVSRIQDEPGPVVCLRRTTKQLLVQLESVGGFIKRYTAINVTEACGFVDLTTFLNGQPKASANTKNSEHTTKPTNTPEVTTPTTTRHQADQEESNFKLQRLKRSLPTSPGTFIRGCQGRGTIPDGRNLHRLCTECAATTRLSDDRFPNYINEVICGDSDHQCASKMGICFQRTLQLSFLRFNGRFELDSQLSSLTGKTVYKEVWEPYTQQIRSCCECEMYPFIYHVIASRDGDDDGDDDDRDEEDDETVT
ncbi:hypothetical protein OS493_020442 [Desmophyllum pertusum]|uniref:Uncharacterized protein n=1 Tax=Desmophyllum pertusum TaxID=174260 RepID=A0A9W9ZBP9_9CNID|nr:hypothetical protein OS493_020442 [Desmophyllum pertusum]